MINDIHIGPITIHMYGLMIALGFLAALGLCLKRGKKTGLEDKHIWNIFYCAIIGGLVGARLLYIIVEIPQIAGNPGLLLDFRNGYVVYGGIIGGVLCAWIYCKKVHAPFLSYFDLVMPSVSLAQCLGRIGCFCAGCCYGRETDSAISIIYLHSAYAPNGVSLIPTQLISSAGNLVLCLILLGYADRNPRCGGVSSAWMIFYGIGRFAVEFLRNDYRGSVGILSTSQLISIVMIIAGITLWICVNRTLKEDKK